VAIHLGEIRRTLSRKLARSLARAPSPVEAGHGAVQVLPTLPRRFGFALPRFALQRIASIPRGCVESCAMQPAQVVRLKWTGSQARTEGPLCYTVAGE
jgi:hypothetical protein